MPEVKNWFLRCRVGAGMFGSERSVSFRVNGHEETALVAVEDVIPNGPLPAAGEVDGFVRVRILERKADQALVDLPSDTFASGMRLIVPTNLLERRLEDRRLRA